MTTTLDVALRYAARGWAVFPLKPAPVKRPITEHGYLDATTDHAQITHWWQHWPSAQIGVACGASGLVFLDVDVKNGAPGFDSIEELQFNHGAHGSGLVMQTPSGGIQVAFQDDADCVRKLGVRPGIDILGDGGYSILPSPASPGRDWIEGDPFDEDDLVPVPGWLAALARRQTKVERQTGTQEFTRELIPAEVADLQAALSYIDADERGVWIKVGMALKSTHAGEQAYELWETWSATSPKFDPVVQRRQWDSLRPDKPGSSVSVETIFYLAQQEGYVPDGLGWQLPQITLTHKGQVITAGASPPRKVAEDEVGRNPTPGRRKERVQKHEPAPASGQLDEAPYFLGHREVAAMPPLEYIVDGLLPANSVSLLAGPSGGGKSFLLIHLAMCMIYDLPFFGRELKKGSVMFLAGEGQLGMSARIRAWLRHHSHLDLDQGDRECVISRAIPTLSPRTMPMLGKAVQTVAEALGHAPSLVIVDTLSQGLEGDESKSEVIAPVIRGMMMIRQQFGCSFMTSHHLGKVKDPKHRFTQADIRGSGALFDNMDCVWALLPDGLRCDLTVWKQKDGGKASERLFLLPVETGHPDYRGDDEWSCIVIPDAAAGLVRQWEADAKAVKAGAPAPVQPAAGRSAIEAHQEACSRIEAAARQLGAFEGGKGGASGTLLVQHAGLRRAIGQAAVESLALDGRLRNTGTKGAPRWMLVGPQEG